MRSTSVARRLLVVTFASLSFAAALPAQDAVAKELIKLEDQWLAAQIKHDGAAIGKMLSDDFLSMGGTGAALTKAQMIKNENESKTTYLSGTASAYQVKVHGTTAVIIGIASYSIKGEKGNATNRYAWTDSWMKQADGKWLCIASQSTPMK